MSTYKILNLNPWLNSSVKVQFYILNNRFRVFQAVQILSRLGNIKEFQYEQHFNTSPRERFISHKSSSFSYIMHFDYMNLTFPVVALQFAISVDFFSIFHFLSIWETPFPLPRRIFLYSPPCRSLRTFFGKFYWMIEHFNSKIPFQRVQKCCKTVLLPSMQ